MLMKSDNETERGKKCPIYFSRTAGEARKSVRESYHEAKPTPFQQSI